MNLPRSLNWTLLGLFALVLFPACSPLPTKEEAQLPAPKADAPQRSTAPAAAEVTNPAGPDRATIRAQLAEHRAAQIAHLHTYGELRQFPYDPVTASAHTFRDPQGRLCAVANLIESDGRHDLVEATVRDNNALAIVDVRSGPMMDWILTSGLTREELDRIQLWPPYPPPQVRKIKSKAAIAEERMKAEVVKHIVEMEMELKRDTDKSLDIAVERYLVAFRTGS